MRLVLIWPFLAAVSGSAAKAAGRAAAPHVIVILADQWRADALGYAGDPDIKTPNLDGLERRSVDFTNAVAGCPVCCPARASLLTGQRPLTHGVFMNDVQLRGEALTLAEVLGSAGYDTGYIGKWHLDGRGRSSYIPPERRQGFRYWKAMECTHSYNNSHYYADGPEKLKWDGYDAIAQTSDAQRYIRERAGTGTPFLLFLAWGPPHAPYHTAPQRYRDLYDPRKIRVHPNVPPYLRTQARADLAGYFAHCTALDDCVGKLMTTLEETGIAEDSIVVFTSDHGDLIGSHSFYKKQQPYEESVRIPMLWRYPRALGRKGRRLDSPMNLQDVMPTLLGLCGLKIPVSVEGIDFSAYMRGGEGPSDGAALLTCPQPFGQWARRWGGREFRGIRTARYTYVRDLRGPWLLFDNEKDPFQLDNLTGHPGHAGLQAQLDGVLQRKLNEAGDRFLPGRSYLEKWGYAVDATGTVPYRD